MGRAARKSAGQSSPRGVEVPGSSVEEGPDVVIQAGAEDLRREPVVDVGRDVSSAAELLLAGRPARLQQERGLSVNLEELSQALAEGPVQLQSAYDSGSNLFAEIGQNPLRGNAEPGSWTYINKSPDINGDFDLAGPFLAKLQVEGYHFEEESVSTANLRATCQTLESNKTEKPFIVVTEDDYIVYGNSDWAGEVARGATEVPVQRVRGLSASSLWSLASSFAKERGLS